jgi:hypothetical protein
MSSKDASEGRRGTEGVSDAPREAKGRSIEEEKGIRDRVIVDSWGDTRQIRPPAAAIFVLLRSQAHAQ